MEINIIRSFYTDKEELSHLSLQDLEDGTGNLYRKTFEIKISGTYAELEEKFLEFKKDMNSFSTNPIIKLPKNENKGVPVTEGNRLIVELLGPYNGPMEVVQADRKTLKLQTLEHHPKVGSISFSVDARDFYQNVFRVETESRSKDFFFHIAKSKTKVISAIEDSVWKELCVHFKGRMEGKDPKSISTDLVQKTVSELDYPSDSNV